MKKQTEKKIINRDNDGNVIPVAYPVSKNTKRDHRKTSVVYTVLAFLLHVLAIVPPIAATLALALRSYELVPYYSFWPWVGVIVMGAFGIIYAVVTLIVTRKRSKTSIMGQTVKVALTYLCLTTVFAMILSYVVPDYIGKATSGTLYPEDLYYKPEDQLEINARYDRDFIMFNLLNGNLNDFEKKEDGTYGIKEENGVEVGDFSYKTLSQQNETSGNFDSYKNAEIDSLYRRYMTGYTEAQYAAFEKTYITPLATEKPRKYELYDFIYKSYVCLDFDYALSNNTSRRAFALSIVDYIYNHCDYESYLKQGFSNARIKHLYDYNFDNFNQDGYMTFDDALLLYAQISSRMTVPVVLRLILNEGWTYTQSVQDPDGNLYLTDDGQNLLYELYDRKALEDFIAAGGSFDYEGEIVDIDGNKVKVPYGFNEKGWQIYQNGLTKRSINWLVLDMLGTPLDVTQLDLKSMIDPTIWAIVERLINMFGGLTDSVGDLLTEDLQDILDAATNGSTLQLGIYFNDNNQLAISVVSMNVPYGMIGYQQAAYVQSNTLLMAVINVFGLRNWLFIFGGFGVMLVIAAGILREIGSKTRERTEIARDRIIRANSQPVAELNDIEAIQQRAKAEAEAEKARRRAEEEAEAERLKQEAKEQKELEKQAAEEEKARKAEEKQREKEEKEREKEAEKEAAAAKQKEEQAKAEAEKQKQAAKPAAPRPANGQRPAGTAPRPANGQRPAGTAPRPANGQRPAGQRPAGTAPRPANGQRPAGQRPAGQRPPTGNRPNGGGPRPR